METTNKNTNDSGTSQEEEINSQVNSDALLEQLGILNLSLNTLYIVLIAIIMNIEFVDGQIVKVLDQLNNTNFSEELPDLTKIPRISNDLFLYATTIFLLINYKAFRDIEELPSENIDKRAEQRAWRAFFSSFLVLVATSISSSNLEV